jgi:hypothetical protein
MKTILALVILCHGLIHLIGFSKAFNLSESTTLKGEISKFAGIFWLMGAILFTCAALGSSVNSQKWPLLAIVGVFVSQALIFTVWQDAKYGTLINILVLVLAISFWKSLSFQNQFKNDVENSFRRDFEQNHSKIEQVEESDLEGLSTENFTSKKYFTMLGRMVGFK